MASPTDDDEASRLQTNHDTLNAIFTEDGPLLDLPDDLLLEQQSTIWEFAIDPSLTAGEIPITGEFTTGEFVAPTAFMGGEMQFLEELQPFDLEDTQITGEAEYNLAIEPALQGAAEQPLYTQPQMEFQQPIYGDLTFNPSLLTATPGSGSGLLLPTINPSLLAAQHTQAQNEMLLQQSLQYPTNTFVEPPPLENYTTVQGFQCNACGQLIGGQQAWEEHVALFYSAPEGGM